MTLNVLPKPTLIKRVTHVIVVALCTASSLTLLGAVPAKLSSNPKPAATPAVTTSTPTLPSLAAISRQIDTTVELLQETVAELPTISPAPRTRVMRMEVTAYCPCTKCCGPNAQGITASGKLVSYNDGKFVAADTKVLPFGTKLVIPGYADGAAVEVVDRGGAIKGNKLDLYFSSHAEALVWGRQHVDVTVYE